MTDPLPSALVLTVSDGVIAGTRPDRSGPVLAELLEVAGFQVERAAVPDDRDAIARAVRAAAIRHRLVVTTGGTGMTPRDVTPQALRPLLDYEVPGFGELMRSEGRRSTLFASLSRSLGGVIGRCLVLAVPGSPGGARESLEAVLPVLAHALETLANDSSRHAAAGGQDRSADRGR
jgi:molybdenum cofactor synthesis domain-containing protein